MEHNAVYGESVLYNAVFTRDGIGRIDTVTESVLGGSEVIDYTYDTVGRLIELRRDGMLVSEYGYDDNGNRIKAVNPEEGLGDFMDFLYDASNCGRNRVTLVRRVEIKLGLKKCDTSFSPFRFFRSHTTTSDLTAKF